MPTRTEVKKGKMLKACPEVPIRSASDKTQFNVQKDIKEARKIKEKDVFEGLKSSKKSKKGKKK